MPRVRVRTLLLDLVAHRLQDGQAHRARLPRVPGGPHGRAEPERAGLRRLHHHLHAELARQVAAVEEAPHLRHALGGGADQVGALQGDGAPGGREAAQAPGVGAGHQPPGPDPLAVGGEVVHGEGEVGESRPEARRVGPRPRGVEPGRHPRVAVRAAGRERGRQRLGIVRVPRREVALRHIGRVHGSTPLVSRYGVSPCRTSSSPTTTASTPRDSWPSRRRSGRWGTSASSPRTPTAAPSAGASPSTIRSTWRRSSSPTAPRPSRRTGRRSNCVRFAALGLIEHRPDLIVSGINLGLNLGDDVTYSGTVAAALEGTLLGIPALAASAHAVNAETADQWDDRAYDFRAVAAFAAAVAPRLLEPDFPERVVLNINAPGLPPEAVTGAEVTRLGRRTVQRRAHAARRAGRPPPVHDLRRHRVAPPRGGHRLRRDRGRRDLGHAAALRPHGPGEHGGGRGARARRAARRGRRPRSA